MSEVGVDGPVGAGVALLSATCLLKHVSVNVVSGDYGMTFGGVNSVLFMSSSFNNSDDSERYPVNRR